jgi:transposase
VEERGDLDLNVFEAGRQAGLEEPAANVPPPVAGGEEPVVGQQRWEDIRKLRSDGMNVSAIARATGMDRKTVRRCLRQVQWQPYRRARSEQTLLSMHSDWLAERAPEVNYSARILFQELRAGRGYAGSYQTVRDAVRPLRVNATAASLTQRRFETEPGEPGPKATSTSGWPRCWPRTSTASSTWAG